MDLNDLHSTTVDEPPAYSQESSLRPITTQEVAARRYFRNAQVELPHTVIPAGCSTLPEPGYLPLHWRALTQPEGKLYFYRDQPLRIVTDDYLYNPDVLDRILRWARHIESLLHAQLFVINPSIELLLQLDDDDQDICYYYFIDHSTLSQFWIHEVCTEELGLCPGNPKYVLEEQYWSHVSYFPNHLTLRKEAIRDLIDIVSHAQTDALTSSSSTFPYDANQCARILDILRTPYNDPPSVYTTCLVARLWGFVSLYRYSNHHGEEHARLCRTQQILAAPPQQTHWTHKATSALLFRIPDLYRARFDAAFVDKQIYVYHWQRLVAKCAQEWATSLVVALVLLPISAGLCMLTTGSVRCMASVSLVPLIECILSSLVLLLRSRQLEAGDDLTASVYSAHSDTYGFSVLATAAAVPSAAGLWGALALVGAGLASLFRVLPLPLAVATLFFIVVPLGLVASLGAVVLPAPPSSSSSVPVPPSEPACNISEHLRASPFVSAAWISNLLCFYKERVTEGEIRV